MQSRVQQFEAAVKLTAEELSRPKVSPCRVAFAQWLVSRSAAFAARSVSRAPPMLEEESEPNHGLVFL